MKLIVALELYSQQVLSRQARGSSTARSLSLLLEPALDQDISMITRADLAVLVGRLSEGAPIHANRSLAYARSFFVWAVSNELATRNPAVGISRPAPELPRARGLTIEEIGHIWNAAGALGYPFEHATRLLILTAGKREDVAAMRVQDLVADPQGAIIWLPNKRVNLAGFPLRIPLAPAASDVIKAALAHRPAGSPFVLTGSGRNGVSGWSRAKRRLDQQPGADGLALQPWRMNDFRDTFATVARDILDVDQLVIDACLGRVSQYHRKLELAWLLDSRLEEDQRAALTAWAELISTASGAAKIGTG